MRKHFYVGAIMLLAVSDSFSQETLVFKGTVRCMISNDELATRGAKNVVVVPGFVPQKSGQTSDQGYYELNTGVPISRLQDKSVAIYYYSACEQCVKKVIVFVAPEMARENFDQTLSYITVETIKMKAGCKQTEPDPLMADKELSKFISQPGTDISKVSGMNVVTAPPSLLNLLTEAVAAEAVGGPPHSPVDATIPFQGGFQNNFGKFLLASPMYLTANPGFNFSPSRLKSEAVFWNPAALAPREDKQVGGAKNGMHQEQGDVQVFLNFKNNIKLSGYYRLNDRMSIGLGGIYTKRDAFQEVQYVGMSGTVSHPQNIQEFAVFMPLAYRIGKRWSMGVTAKFMGQRFNLPQSMSLDSSPSIPHFTDTNITRHQFDGDLSLNYDILPSLTLGINYMNIAGSKLYAEPVLADPHAIPYTSMRSLGLGICYRWKRFNIGTDVLLASDSLYDVTTGVNYVPFNNALICAGYAFRQKSYSLSFKWGHFMTTYLDDKGYMLSQKKPGKSEFLNGRLYTSVIFDFH
jgi:hypothetical protein